MSDLDFEILFGIGIPECVLESQWNIHSCRCGPYFALEDVPQHTADIKEFLILPQQSSLRSNLQNI